MRRGPLVSSSNILKIVSHEKTELRFGIKRPRELEPYDPLFQAYLKEYRDSPDSLCWHWFGEWETTRIALPPFGMPGEIRWIPETWGLVCPESTGDDGWWKVHKRPIVIHPDSNPVDGIAGAIYKRDGPFDFNLDYSRITWRSPAAMPQWASRIYVKWMDLTVEPKAGWPQEWVYTLKVVSPAEAFLQE